MEPNVRRIAELHTGGELFKHYGGLEIADRVIGAGGTMLDFNREVGEHVRATNLDAAFGLDLTNKDVRRYSLSKAINSYVNPTGDPRRVARFEHEIHDEIERQTGRTTGMLMVPFSVFARDFNIGSGTQAGALVDAPVLHEHTGDPLRNALAFARLGTLIAGGFRSDFSVPRFTTDVSGGFLTEVDSASESSPATAQVAFTARRFSGYVEPSKQALTQIGPLESYLRRALIESAAAAIESGAINGDGIAPNMTGIRNTVGIGTVVGGGNGAQLTFAHLADLEAAPGTANAPEESGGFLVNTKTRRWLRTQPRGTGLPYGWEGGEGALVGFRAAVTNNAPSNLTKGTATTVCSSVLFSSDWSKSMLAVFGAPGITVDTRTMAPTGQARITLDLYASFGIFAPGAFAKMDDALTT